MLLWALEEAKSERTRKAVALKNFMMQFWFVSFGKNDVAICSIPRIVRTNEGR